MNEKPSPITLIAIIKAIAIGFIMGVIGVSIGAFPIMYLRNQVFEFLKSIYGSYFAVPDVLHYLVLGYPLYIGAIVLLPVGGALVGIIGAVIGLIKRSTRTWLWGGVAGLLLNFIVSFHAQ